MGLTPRTRRWGAGRRLSAALACAALIALLVPALALSLNSFYVNRNLNPGESDHHPTTRVWNYNDMAALSPSATRIWIYIPGSGYYYDSGNQIGSLTHGGPSVPSVIWCQNWSASTEGAQCLGGYS